MAKPKVLDVIKTGMPGKGTVKMRIHHIGPDAGGIECVHFQDSDGVFGAEAVEDLKLEGFVDIDRVWRVKGEKIDPPETKEVPKWLSDGLKARCRRATR